MIADVLPTTADSNTIGYWLGLLFVAVGGWAGIKKGFAQFQKAANLADVIEEKFKSIAQIEATLRTVMSDLRPNGGNSLRDRLEAGISIVTGIGNRLAAVEATQRAGMSSFGDGMFISDGDGRCLFASARLCEIMGVTKDDILGDGWRASIHPDDAARVFAEWDSFSAQRRKKFEARYRYVKPDGSIVSIECRATRDADTEGKVVRIVGSVHRLTGVQP